MCKFQLPKHFICKEASFEIVPETGKKSIMCYYYKNGKCCKNEKENN